jgi:excisionase family DNA binding protein
LGEYDINPNEMYTAAEAAALLKVSTRTMRRYLRDGVVKGVQLRGYQWRVRGANLIDIESRHYDGRTLFEEGQTVALPAQPVLWVGRGSAYMH